MKRLFGLLAVALLPGTVRAQQTPDDVVAHAVALQDSGRWTDGRTLLFDQLRQCDASSCRLLVTRALGYTYQRQAQREPAERLDLLSRAVSYYNDALKDDPADAASLSNLAVAYRALGRDDELEALLRHAADRDSGGTAFYALMLGDFYQRRASWSRARAAYARAVDAAPDDETARRRLVEVYTHLSDDWVMNLFRTVSRAPDWEARFPDVAIRAYELAASRLAPRDSQVARDAAYRWLTLLAGTRQLTAERLDALREPWLAPDLDRLKLFIESPAKLPPYSGLWGSLAGREALTRVALALGQRQLAAGDSKGADAYFWAGMRVSGGAAPATLDIAVELAALYDGHPEFDPGQAKFRSIEAELFVGKAEAYQRADREAIQRFHSTLGLIYAQRGVWQSRDAPWTNALFQLEHALSTARDRDAAERTYQPLPQLRALLADAYRANERPAEARSMYLEAAQAYLDVDQLPQASGALDRGRTVAPGTSDRRIPALGDLIQSRMAAAARPERPSAETCESDANGTARRARAAGLATAFTARQRFKVLADCLVSGPAPVRPADAARVLNAAVDSQIPLVGVGDLVRIQRSQAVVNRTLRLPTRVSQPSGPTLKLQLPSDSRPTDLRLNPDAVKGAAVLQQVGGDPTVKSVRVTRGTVTVETAPTSSVDSTRLQNQLATFKDVRLTYRGLARDTAKTAVDTVKPPEDPRAALNALVQRYAHALETRKVASVRGVVPTFDAKALEVFFGRAGNLQAQLQLGGFEVRGDTVQADIAGVLSYVDLVTHTPKRERFRRRARFDRVAGAWTMVSIE